MRCSRAYIILVLCMITVCTVLSQNQPGTLRSTNSSADSSSFASLGFDKNFNTYRWNARTIFFRELGPTTISFNEQFLSSLIQTQQPLIRDEQLLAVSLKHRFSESIRGVLKDSSFNLSDNRSQLIGNTSFHILHAGIEYRPVKSLTIEPRIGVRYDKQFDQQEKGPSYYLGIYSDPLDYLGYQASLFGKIQYDKLSPRTLETRSAGIDIVRNFFESTRNAFHVEYDRLRRDYYSSADAQVRQQFNITNNIETRLDQSYSIIDTLDYSVGKSGLLSFQGGVFSRTIERNTQYKLFSSGFHSQLNTTIDELRIDGGTSLRYSLLDNSVGVMVGFNYQERDEKHRIEPDGGASKFEIDNQTRLEESKNNHSKRTMISSSVDIQLSRNHSVRLLGSGNLLRYDTPSASNDDDRDELWYIFNIMSFHRLSQYFTMQFASDINLTHLVYIGSTRSANNTWNRIFRLSPRLEYRPSSDFKTINTFEVLANYTVYDTEFLFSSARSYVFRQFGFADSSTFRLTNRITFEWYNLIRLYERGELNWDAFKERPTNYFVDKTYLGKIGYGVTQRLIFSVGIRYFSQLRFGYNGSSRNLESTIVTVGPVAQVSWNAGNRTELLVNGWYENQSQTGVSDRGLATVFMVLTVHI